MEPNMTEQAKNRAILNLMGELAKGERNATENGWVSMEDAEKALGVTLNPVRAGCGVVSNGDLRKEEMI